MMIVPVILAGGVGSRLWPLSREIYPKQFAELAGDKTLIQSTAERCNGLNNVASPIVVCNEEHRFTVLEQLAEVGIEPSMIILEPVGRNTAPALAAAAHYLVNECDVIMLAMPADHIIEDVSRFHRAVEQGKVYVEQEQLVTFGIEPTKPKTGYGYIEKGDVFGEDSGYKIKRFVEKPDKTTAEEYIKQGTFLWNSGMFMMKPQAYLTELSALSPDISKKSDEATTKAKKQKNFLYLNKKSFEECPNDSIDYAVMEKTQNAVVIPLSAGWNDVGSWVTLSEQSTADENGNVKVGDVLTHNVKNSYLHSTHRMLAVTGVENYVVVETRDAVLVAHKDSSQDIKKLVSNLKENKRYEAISHTKVYRPWGSYETLETGPRFLVKRIIVKAGASLSLQMHQHRSEHWVIVAGTAEVTRDNETFILNQDQSAYIPKKVKHRLKNTGEINLEIIEVQVGDVLSEDDITRFDDNYGRIPEKAETV